jgi:prolyl oligopeptidase
VQHHLGNEQYQAKPLVIRVDVKAGHGAGKPIEKVLKESADSYAFIARYVGASWKD